MDSTSFCARIREISAMLFNLGRLMCILLLQAELTLLQETVIDQESFIGNAPGTHCCRIGAFSELLQDVHQNIQIFRVPLYLNARLKEHPIMSRMHRNFIPHRIDQF